MLTIAKSVNRLEPRLRSFEGVAPLLAHTYTQCEYTVNAANFVAFAFFYGLERATQSGVSPRQISKRSSTRLFFRIRRLTPNQ